MRRSANLGGIRCVADVKGRCRVDEDTGCWLWALGVTHDGQPKVEAVIDGIRVRTTGGRIVWHLVHGEIAPKHVVYRARCCDKLCVNPAHLSCGTKAEAGVYLKRSGHLRGDPARSIINGRNRCSAKVVLDLAKAREIRASEASVGALAVLYGTSRSTIVDTLRMKRWREPGWSVFSRLAA